MLVTYSEKVYIILCLYSVILLYYVIITKALKVYCVGWGKIF